MPTLLNKYGFRKLLLECKMSVYMLYVPVYTPPKSYCF